VTMEKVYEIEVMLSIFAGIIFGILKVVRVSSTRS